MTTDSPPPLEAMLAVQGLSLEPERLEAALAVHTALRPSLERLRSLPMSYLEPVVEPASALTWIENGGRR